MNTTDMESIVGYLEKMVKIPSPTGFTDRIIVCLKKHAMEMGFEWQETKKGSIFFKFPGTSAKPKKIMLAAHVDTLGAMVTEVRDQTLKLALVGTYPYLYLIGDYCKIHTFDGQSFEGTILPDNPASHVNKNLSELNINRDTISVRPDIVLEEGESLADYFQSGNFISLDPKFTRVNGFIKTRHLDDKAPAAIMLHLADRLKEEPSESDIYLYFNVTEETGQGISGLPELDELIIMDMGVVGEGCQGTEFDVSLCTMDSSGPYHYGLTRRLAACAEKAKIPYKTDVFPYYSSDGSTYLRGGHDVKTALIGPGVGASHGYERTHEIALDRTYRLVWTYIKENV